MPYRPLESGEQVRFLVNTGEVLEGVWLGTNSRSKRRNRVRARGKVWNVTTQNIRDHTTGLLEEA